nr:glycogen-debranching protein [Deltaproteobacteria bacterium]
MRKHLLGSLAYSLALLTLTSCAVSTDDDAAGDGEGKFDSLATSSSGLGAAYSNDGKLARFRVKSAPATRVEVYLYAKASGEDERAKYEMTRDAKGVWSVEVPVSELTAAGLSSTVFYGYRAWGPNWTSDSAWTKGSSAGFKSDVDAAGNRFNPNKLLLDPYAIEMSHDPVTPSHLDGTVYASGPAHRTKDSGRVAPKGVLVKIASATVGPRPSRPLKDEVIYEVHVRGLTMNDPSIASELRGTYAGAAQQAAYLKSVGVTAVEFLPVQETQNDQNDIAMTTN